MVQLQKNNMLSSSSVCRYFTKQIKTDERVLSTLDMQMMLITHADRQNANICFSVRPTVNSRKTNVYQKGGKKYLYALMYTCDVSYFGVEQKHTNLSVSCRFRQILTSL